MTDTKQFGFEDLKKILVDRVGLAEDQVGDDLSQTFDDLGLDSLAFVEIQLAMEQDYGITVEDEDAEKIHSLQEAIDYVNSKLAEAN
jgi:acyl carrier protein